MLWLLFLLPLVVWGELRTDIEFARPGGKPLAMDAFVPEGKGPFPAVIWVHGGGFTAGDKAPPPLSVLEPIAQMGYAWFSVNYRLSPEYVFPAATDDVESAIAYIKAHAAEYKVDGRKLVLMGASAGGHLVSFVGARHAKENEVTGVVSFFGEHDLVDRVHPSGPCMIDGKVVEQSGPMCISPGLRKFLGISGSEPRAEKVVTSASPAKHIYKGMPAYLLIHGTKDFNVPFEQSERMCEAMQRAGQRCELVPVEGGGHGFGAWDKDTAMAGYKPKLLEWLKRMVR